MPDFVQVDTNRTVGALLIGTWYVPPPLRTIAALKRRSKQDQLDALRHRDHPDVALVLQQF